MEWALIFTYSLSTFCLCYWNLHLIYNLIRIILIYYTFYTPSPLFTQSPCLFVLTVPLPLEDISFSSTYSQQVTCSRSAASVLLSIPLSCSCCISVFVLSVAYNWGLFFLSIYSHKLLVRGLQRLSCYFSLHLDSDYFGLWPFSYTITSGLRRGRYELQSTAFDQLGWGGTPREEICQATYAPSLILFGAWSNS